MAGGQVVFTERELLEDDDGLAPVFAGGLRCHGGFGPDGRYVSPRTKNRWPAIEAWELQRRQQFGTEALDIPLDTWPDSFPNVAQSKLLLRHGVRRPTIAALTRIGTIEGFGAMLRYVPVPDFRRCFEEDVEGTAIDHISRGLFEAHARDEAGYGDAAGHNEMWFAARDIAFENPVTHDESDRMLERMGVSSPGSASGARKRAQGAPPRLLPDDIDPDLETVALRMIGLLLIEISAFHGFAWAADVLSDDELVAGEGEAAQIVAYIRQDESPHVAWLRTALSEMRDRTWLGSGGKRHSGSEMIGRLFEKALADSLLGRRHEALQAMMREIELATEGMARGRDLVEEMLALGDVARGADGTMVDGGAGRLQSVRRDGP